MVVQVFRKGDALWLEGSQSPPWKNREPNRVKGGEVLDKERGAGSKCQGERMTWSQRVAKTVRTSYRKQNRQIKAAHLSKSKIFY